jgi:hypothetical protein
VFAGTLIIVISMPIVSLAHSDGVPVLKWYAAITVLCIIACTYYTCRYQSAEYKLRGHRWATGAFIVALSGYQHPYFTILHGFFNGIMIEGLVATNLEPIWEQQSSVKQYKGNLHLNSQPKAPDLKKELSGGSSPSIKPELSEYGTSDHLNGSPVKTKNSAANYESPINSFN